MKPRATLLVAPKSSRAMVHNMQAMMVVIETMAKKSEKRGDMKTAEQCNFAYMTLMGIIQAFMSAAMVAMNGEDEDVQVDAAMLLAPEIADA